MESYAFNLEHMLRSEMDATDDAKYQLQEKDEKIEQLENTIEKLKEKNKSLEVTNDKLSGKVEDQEAQIVGFRGQCIYCNIPLLAKYNLGVDFCIMSIIYFFYKNMHKRIIFENPNVCKSFLFF
jgi:hypothetical protein